MDPALASILDSIRETVGGAAPQPMPEPEADAAAPPAAPVAARRTPPPPQQTVEEFLAALIRPQVDAWLAAHLPEIVQKLAGDEIARLTRPK